MNEYTIKQKAIMPASGTWSREKQELLSAARPDFKPDFLVLKGITLNPRPGNDPPRVVETASGMINYIGLPNPGLQVFLEVELPWWRQFGLPLVANISGAYADEYRQVCEQLNDCGLSALEINVSCPNRDGIIFGTSWDLTSKIVKAVRAVTKLPLWVKLTPIAADIAEIALAADNFGADAISAINTMPAMAKDDMTGKWVRGGYSGPCLKPIALHKVEQIAQKIKLPIIGIGGIATARDAEEFFEVGATAIAVGTANFANPLVMAEIASGLRE